MTITKIPSAGLEDTGVTAGTKGSASEIPVVTVNSKGQITSLGGAAINLTWSGLSGKPTNLSQFTNDLGNYGSFVNAEITNQGGTSVRGNCGNKDYGQGYETFKSGTSLGVRYYKNNCYNCDCNCACSC